MEQLVLCVYGMIVHERNVSKIVEKSVKRLATPGVYYAFLVFSKHFSRALSHYTRTQLVICTSINTVFE